MCVSGGSESKLAGFAALQNAATGQEALEIGREQLQWERDRSDRQDPIIEELTQQQIASGTVNAERAADQWDTYKEIFQPIEKKIADDAMGWDSDERKERMAAEAGADVTKSYGAARDSNERRMQGLGVNPNSGKFQGLETGVNIAQAGDTAGAMNMARRNTEKEGLALRTGVAQFGRGMPSTGIAADSLSLNAGNSAVGNMATQTGMRNASMAQANSWYNSSISAVNSAGNLWNSAASNNIKASSANQNMIGELAGAGMGGLAAMMKHGGVIKDGKPVHSGQGLSGQRKKKKTKGYRDGGMVYKNGGIVAPKNNSDHGLSGERNGGMVEGEGTGKSDSIHGTIEGKEPVRLSNGEAVLTEKAVEIVGEEFIHRINEYGLGTSRRAA